MDDMGGNGAGVALRTEVVRVADVVVVDEGNGRLGMDEAAMEVLVSSIRRHGQLTPITVRVVAGQFELIAGRRRLEAMTRMRAPGIRAEVIEADDAVADTLRLTENVVRKELSPVEVAIQLTSLLGLLDGDVDKVARMVGRRLEWVCDRLEIGDWPEDLAEQVHAGRISLGAAKHLFRISDEVRRAELVALAGSTGLSVRQARHWRQQCEAEARYGETVGEGGAVAPLTTFVTRTEVECFACRDRVDIVETRNTWICNRCLAGLEQRGCDPATGEHIVAPPA